MKITHLQSSTVLIDLGGTKILTDPWLVDGEYFGSWYHFPPFETPLDTLEYDYIYISHIHPDHLSKKTLARLDHDKPVLIHSFDEKFLKMNIERAGFTVIELEHGTPFDFPNGGSMAIYSADNCDPEICSKFIGCAPAEAKFKMTRIDTLSVVSDGTHTLLNTNDCPYELSYTTLDRVTADYGDIDVMLVGYAGAGPFPQCFTFSDDAMKRAAADRKRDQFIAQSVKYLKHVKPKAYMPFAGTYILGGRLADLNNDRGVPRLSEALDLIAANDEVESHGFLLNTGASFDTASGETSATYTEPSADELADYIQSIKGNPYDFDDEPRLSDTALMTLANTAYGRFKGKTAQIGFTSKTQIIITDGGTLRFAFSAHASPSAIDALPRGDFVQITVDRRLLGQLLNGPRFAHWNNAEIGSHLGFHRVPDTFERGLYYCLSAFHV